MTSSDPTVTTRIFCISDTHQGHPRLDPYSKDGAFRPPWPDHVDILLHSGDITMFGIMSEYRDSLEMLKSIPAELKLVIAGNHDLSLHESYFLNDRHRNGGLYAEAILNWGKLEYDRDNAKQAHDLWTGPQAKQAGVTYLTEGLYTFDLKNGARFSIYVSPWQPEFFNWAFNYPHNEDRWNPPEYNKELQVTPAPSERDPHPIPMNAHVDLMMTHGPPGSHLDLTQSGHKAGCPHLLRALDRVRPRLHCFGHIHEAWGAERITWQERSGSPHPASSTDKLGEEREIIGGRNDGNMGVTSQSSGVIRPDDSSVIERRAAHIDVSAKSTRPLNFGKETLLINASVVNLDYESVNAGWLVDLELPKMPQNARSQI